MNFVGAPTELGRVSESVAIRFARPNSAKSHVAIYDDIGPTATISFEGSKLDRDMRNRSREMKQGKCHRQGDNETLNFCNFAP